MTRTTRPRKAPDGRRLATERTGVPVGDCAIPRTRRHGKDQRTVDELGDGCSFSIAGAVSLLASEEGGVIASLGSVPRLLKTTTQEAS